MPLTYQQSLNTYPLRLSTDEALSTQALHSDFKGDLLDNNVRDLNKRNYHRPRIHGFFICQ